MRLISYVDAMDRGTIAWVNPSAHLTFYHNRNPRNQFGAFGGDTAYSAEALSFLLKGGHSTAAGGAGDDPPPAEWLSEAAWRMVLELSSLDG